MLKSKSANCSEDQRFLSLFDNQRAVENVSLTQEFGFKENRKQEELQKGQRGTQSQMYFHWIVTLLFLGLVLIPWGKFLSSEMDLKSTLSAPNLNHPLGTDNMGRDLLLRLSGAFLGAVLPLWGSALLGTFFGFASTIFLLLRSDGEEKHWLFFDGIQKFLAATISSFPFGVAVFCVSVFSEMVSLLGVAVVGFVFLGAQASLRMREFYGQSRKLGYWIAHESLGGSLRERILKYGAFGEWRDELLAVLAFNLKVIVVVEAGLSYLGFGVPEPRPSFGNILASHFDLLFKGNITVPLITVASLFVVGQLPESVMSIAAHLKSPRR